ncbi:hypothetical protein LIER_40407 [Lithospermum erythrorhizon]|uniref:Mitochondrial protein n=1 Tax=Lithospermum erythrorhizon TaxID=34254 RepID=A0AAV3QX54_LITER
MHVWHHRLGHPHDRGDSSVQITYSESFQSILHFFNEIGIQHRVSCPHSHEQMGCVERRHRHIVDKGLTLLAHAHLDLSFWHYAFETSVFLINRLPTPVNQVVSHEVCTREVPILSGPVVVATSSLSVPSLPSPGPNPMPKLILPPQPTQPRHSSPIASRPFPISHTSVPSPQLSPSSPLPQVGMSPPSMSCLAPCPTSCTQPPISSISRTTTGRHTMSLRPPPRPNFKKCVTHPHSLSIVKTESEPTCFTQANKCPLWLQAMGDEINAMLRTHTWSLVPSNSTMNIVGCRWIFRLKRDASGNVTRRRARLVSKGNHQV